MSPSPEAIEIGVRVANWATLSALRIGRIPKSRVSKKPAPSGPLRALFVERAATRHLPRSEGPRHTGEVAGLKISPNVVRQVASALETAPIQ